MKSPARIALSCLFTLFISGLMFYASCKKQDNCSGVACVNTGYCADGFCVCPTGVGGDTCENVFRKAFANTYAGSANVNTAHKNYRLVFSIPATTSNYVAMQLTLQDGAGGATSIPVLPLTLSNPTLTTGNFNITSTTVGGYTYTGNGTVYAKLASLTLYKTPASGVDTTYICTNFAVQ